jgi:hypothetical protein
MTEEEWLASPDLRQILVSVRDGATERKLRLYAAACSRHAGPPRLDAAWDQALEAAEGYADGSADEARLAEARERVGRMLPAVAGDESFGLQASAWAACHADAGLAATEAAGLAADSHPEQMSGQTALLRCIFGNPFRPVSFDPKILTPTVLSLAQAAYDERAMPSGELDRHRLGILADALEEAGCANNENLAHLRGPGPHVRGCWVVDLIVVDHRLLYLTEELGQFPPKPV